MEKGNSGTGLGTFIVAYRWVVIIGAVLVFVLSASGGRHLQFSSDSRVFFGENNPQLKALEALENTYTKDDNILLAIAPSGKNIFTSEILSIVEEMTASLWKMPYSSRVDSLTNYQHTWAEEDDLVVEDLVQNAQTLSLKDLEVIKKIALNEPLLKNRVVSPSGHVTGINVIFRLPDDNKKATIATTDIVSRVRSLAKEMEERNNRVKIYITGGLMINNAFSEASQDDIKTLIPVMYLLMILVMWLTLRSVSGTIVSVLIVFLSSVTALGIAGWLGIVLSPPSAMAPTMILTLAIADSIHILVSMLHEYRKGMTKYEAIIESLRLNIQPVFLTSLTTVIGFLSMNFSDVPPFKDLGNIVAIGVAAAFVYSVTILPALMAVLPVAVRKQAEKGNQVLDGFADFVVTQRNRLLWGTSAGIIVLALGIFMIDLNDLYLDYFDKRYTFRNDTDFVSENLTGISIVEYSLNSGEEGGISNPEYLKVLDEFSKWLGEQPEVIQVSVVSDIFKRLNKSMHGDDHDYYRVPEKRDLAAQYLLLYEMSLPFGLDLNNRINVDKSATRVQISLDKVYNREIRVFEKRARTWLEEHAFQSMHAQGTGISMMFAYINKRNVESMLRGTFLALVLISVILVFALRSVKIGLISLIPNLVPAIMSFGLWGITVSRVGLAVSVVAAISLGIVVDDTVHFLSKYLRARREQGMDSESAVRYAFHNVGRPLVITSLILIAGFGVLTFSGFKVNANMGILTAIAIAFALCVDFLLLPPILMNFDRKKKVEPSNI